MFKTEDCAITHSSRVVLLLENSLALCEREREMVNRLCMKWGLGGLSGEWGCL